MGFSTTVFDLEDKEVVVLALALALASTPWYLIIRNECALCNEKETVLTFSCFDCYL